MARRLTRIATVGLFCALFVAAGGHLLRRSMLGGDDRTAQERITREVRNAFAIMASLLVANLVAAAGPRPVIVTVDATRSTGTLPPVWRFFGADEPNYATMKDGRKLLTELGKLRPGQVYFRAHNLLSTGDGTPAFKWGSTNIYTEDAAGNPVYAFTVVDRIIDTYVRRLRRKLEGVSAGFEEIETVVGMGYRWRG